MLGIALCRSKYTNGIPLMKDNQGSIDWIESGCKPTKKLRHKNLSELGIREVREHKEVKLGRIWGDRILNVYQPHSLSEKHHI